ncbi:MAG TPA: sigma-54 dependent transcriptional regulator [Thermoanaerobaculia bacterium]|nr:sigma-54 dependent transcriptional regulator [Thermoanaerobaculia bacterium]
MKLDARILVVDDQAAQRELLAGFLRDLGAEVLEAADGRQALEQVRRSLPDVVLSDVRMPEMDGRDLLRAVKRGNPEVEVILVTAYATVAEAVACLKDCAADYLLKPLDLDEVEHVLRLAVERRHLRRENRELRRRIGEIESLPGIVTAGGAMAEVLSTVARAAASAVPVLILGESGTGKELVARAIHAASPRASRPFLAINGASLSPTLLESELFGHERGSFTGAERSRKGRFELASGGTFLLDEVGDLPPEVQVKLLRVLQEGSIERVGSAEPIPVDVRVVAATHRDLLAAVAEGRFREDLYYRLAVVTVELPPLRRRRADIPLLVEHFRIKHDGERKEFSREAMDLLVSYDYPGNVRELENIVQRSLLLCRTELIVTDDLPATVCGQRQEVHLAGPGDDASLPRRVAALERSAIEKALMLEAGHQSRAAVRLGISERALRYKLRKLGLKSARQEEDLHAS